MKKILLLLIGIVFSTQVSYSAISVGNSSSTTEVAATSTRSIQFTVNSGTDGILFVNIGYNITSTGQTCSYGGNGMTLSSSTGNLSGTAVKLFHLLNPTVGTANILCSQTGSTGGMGIGAVVFNGAKQEAPQISSGNFVVATTSYSQSLTTLADNSYLYMTGLAQSGAAITAGANTTLVSQAATLTHGLFMLRSTGGQTPTGTYSLAFTSASQAVTGLLIAIAPSTGAPAVVNNSSLGFFRFFRFR